MKILLLYIIFLVLIFSQENMLSVYVIEKTDSKAVSGIKVELSELKFVKYTNFYGFALFEKIPSGTYTLRVSENGKTYYTKKIKFKVNESLSKIVKIERIISNDVSKENASEDDIAYESAVLNVRGEKGIASSLSSGTQMKRKSLRMPQYLQEHNTEEYHSFSENGFKDALTEPLSTFSADVDRASYSNVRRILKSGQLPSSGAVRTEEFINYFAYSYEKPSTGPFSFFTEYGICPWNEENKLLHIAVNTKEILKSERKAGNYVFLLDVSGSMSAANKLPLLKQSLLMMLSELNDRDYISIVVYAGAAGRVLEPTKASDKKKIVDALERLQAGGSTAGAEGIELAYKTAKENFLDNGNNRVILATDGDFNVGPSSESALVEMIEKKRKEGIFLTVLGFGMGNYKDSKLEQLADKGNGNYAYIDNLMEAKKTLVTEFGSTLEVIAKDVKFQIEFNPKFVKSYRLVGYENRKLENKDFENDQKDAGEVGAGHSVTILYEIVPSDNSNGNNLRYQDKKIKNSDELAFLKVRYKKPDEDKSILIEREIKNKLEDVRSESFQLATTAASFSLLLKNSEYNKNMTFVKLEAYSRRIKQDDYGYIGELKQLISLAKTIESMKSISSKE
jgi:Ca-activated chloride channel homolog